MAIGSWLLARKLKANSQEPIAVRLKTQTQDNQPVEKYSKMNASHPNKLTPLGFILLLSLLLATSGSLPVRGADPEPGMTIPSLRDSLELAAFMDGLMASTMDGHRAAGAMVSIIQDGDLLFQRGYGYANIADSVKVDPGRTLFRIGSTSKLFTWIAVLQQVEAGRLDLDRDVNDYLVSFQVPDTYEEPVTLRSLLSHTPGFEDVLLKLFMRDGDDIPSLEEILTKQMPRRVRPPLEEAAYSNHGTGLAQYLVEKVSGLPFETYADRHIFEPLGMESSTFSQPLPRRLANRMATGYAFSDGAFREEGFEIVPMTGAGGASTTAADMTIFMDALLNHGRRDTIQIMDSLTFSIMKTPLLTHAKGMNPTLHGFLDTSPQHVRVIGHGGNTFLFHSQLALFPEHDTGLFVSFSGSDAALAYDQVMKHFIQRFFPDQEEAPPAIELDKEYLEGFAGTYLSNRRPHSDILKVIGLTNRVEVKVEGNKLLYTDFFGNSHLMPAIDSTTFRIPEKNTLVGFARAPGEKAQQLYMSDYPIMAAERPGRLYNAGLHIFILVVTLTCILYILIVWPWLYFARRLYDKKPRTRKPLPVFSRTVAWVTSLFLLLFYLLVFMAAGGEEIIFGIPPGIRIGLFFPLAAIPFILLMLASNVYIWKQPQTKNLSRLFYSLTTLVFILAFWQLYFFNMLGWQY